MCFNIEYLQKEFKKEIQFLPDHFYDTFDYTKTGNNLAHPITLGILCKILSSLDWAARIGIDVRLNIGKKQKFQPDIVVYDDMFKSSGIKLFIDYESPNSSDARIPRKDVQAYLRWTNNVGLSVPYVIITTLPDKQPERWEVRYTSKTGCNFGFRNRKEEIAKNPFVFWYKYYSGCDCLNHKHIHFLNVNNKEVNYIRDLKI